MALGNVCFALTELVKLMSFCFLNELKEDNSVNTPWPELSGWKS